MRARKLDVYRTAIYCRLSDEDYVKKRDVSESIENQLSICRKYIEEHPDLMEAAVYIDDGRTGLNYNRDGYIQMMEDVDMGQIDCIITKTLARLGREHAETIKLFKQTFVIKHLRYIAVVDNIDFNGMIESMDIPFKVVMNDNYSMETSKNVRSAFKSKAGRGEFIGSFAPYGYKKDEKDKSKLIIDPVAAEVVKRIYAEFIAGSDISNIVHGLNDDDIPCPSVYKKNQGCNYSNNRRLEKTYYWTYSTVKKILLDESEVYIGNMVQHRTEKLAYNMDKLVAVPKDEWIRSENTHEAIIEKKDHDLVQRFVHLRWKPMDCKKKLNKFAGIVYCGECGRCLVRTKRKSGEVLRCSTYARIGVNYCSQHLIYEYELEDLVLKAIQDNISDALENMDLEKLKNQKETTQANLEKSRLNAKLDALENSYKKMIMNLSAGIISEDDFLIFKEEYAKQKKFIESRICMLQKRKDDDTLYMSEYQIWLDNFLKYREIKELTRDVVVSLIDRIDVYEDPEEDIRRIEINFRFRKPSQNR